MSLGKMSLTAAIGSHWLGRFARKSRSDLLGTDDTSWKGQAFAKLGGQLVLNFSRTAKPR